MTKFDKLMMTIGLTDNVSGEIGGIIKTLDKLKAGAKSAFADITKGFGTIAAVGAVTTATLFPAGDVYAALGEVKSLGVGAAGLTSLRHESASFAAQWGNDSGAFIRSAYDIQSSIAGLSETELPRATRTAGILAKATKSSVADMTSFFGSMYGIFKTQADDIGKSEWLEQLAGKTAAAVQLFKTTGPAMQQAFESLGQGATNAGVSLDNQLAILGTLQSTMAAGNAGTSFNAFIRGLSNGAGDKLGLNFANENGQMLSTIQILEKIKNKYSDLSTLAAKGDLQKAFGDEGLKFVDALITKQGVIKKNIADIAKQQSIDKAIEMAEAMTAPWERIIFGSKALVASVGFDSLSDAIPILNNVADAIGTAIKWSQKYKNVNDLIATSVGYVLSFAAALGGLWVGIGIFKLLAISILPIKFLLIPIVGLYKAMRVGLLAYLMVSKLGVGVMAASRFALASFVGQMYASVMANKAMRVSLWLLKAPFVVLFFLGGKFASLMKLLFLTTLKNIAAFKAHAITQWANVTAVGKHYLAMGRLSIAMALTSAKAGITTGVMVVQKIAMTSAAIATGVLSGAMNLLKAAFLTSLPVIAAFSAALLANPLTWIAAAVIAVGTGLYFLITRWDDFVNAFRNNEWMKTLFFPIYMGIELIDLLVKNFHKIPEWFNAFKQWLGSINIFDALGNGLDWLIEKINLIPGINIKTSSSNEHTEELKASLPSLNDTSDIPTAGRGGIMQQYINTSNNSNRGHQIDTIEVHNHGQGTNAQDLMYELEMAAS